MSAPNLPVLAYDAGGGVRIEACKRRDQPAQWAVRWQGDCLSCDGEWEWEPSPSNRDDNWLARHRFATAADAHAALCRSRGESAPVHDDTDALSDRVAAAGVRQLLAGELTGPPLPGTLAAGVYSWIQSAYEVGISDGMFGRRRDREWWKA